MENGACVKIILNTNRMIADNCVRLLYKTDVLSKHSLRERILTYFYIMKMKHQSNTFRIKMSREQFAQYLCVNRSALSRELSRMEKEGLIKVLPNGQITVISDVTQII